MPAILAEFVGNQKHRRGKAVIQILQMNWWENCAVNCVHSVDIFTLVHVSIQQNFKWTLRRGEGGGGSDLNVQLTLRGEKMNMSTAPKKCD